LAYDRSLIEEGQRGQAVEAALAAVALVLGATDDEVDLQLVRVNVSWSLPRHRAPCRAPAVFL